MRKLIIIFLVLLPLNLSAFQNEPDGFRNIKWGTDIKKVNNMIYISSNEQTTQKLYRRKNDELRIGESKLTDITYAFDKGKLIDVMIRAKGYSNWIALKGVCFEKFGEGDKQNSYVEQYSWLGDVTIINLEYNEFTKEAVLFMSSMKALKQRKEDEKQKAKEGAEKGF